MGIAVVASKDGFEGLDDDIRRRMRAIHASAEKYYDPQRDPSAKEKAAGQDAKKLAEGDGSTAGPEGTSSGCFEAGDVVVWRGRRG